MERDEVIFEIVYDPAGRKYPWRVVGVNHDELGCGPTPVAAVCDAERFMWNEIGEGIDWKRRAVDEISTEDLPEGMRDAARALLDAWCIDVYGEPANAGEAEDE